MTLKAQTPTQYTPGQTVQYGRQAAPQSPSPAYNATAQRIQPRDTPPSAEELFRPPIVMDAHEDVLLNLFNPRNNRSLAEPGQNGQANFANWHAGGVNAVFFAVWLDPRKYQGRDAVNHVEEIIAFFRQQVRQYPDKLVACDTSDDVRRAVASGRIAALLGIEGGIAINNDLAMIAHYRQLGVRYMTLTWRGNLDWAGSSQPLYDPGHKGPEVAIARNPSKGGLTEFGRQVVAEMNRVGMMVDLSHVSDQTFYDAIKVSRRPVIVSHSDCRALGDHPRNVTDDMLRALKANGGVIGINLWYELLEPNGRKSRTPGAKRVTVETVLDHIDHIVKIAGIDHVGLGTDFEGMNDLPKDMQNASTLPRLFEGMRRRGYSEQDIRKFAAENFLRVMKANETPAK